MKTLSTPITNEIAAAQSGWCECYKIELKSAITTPAGSTSTLWVTTNPAGQTFDLATCIFWPVKRGIIKSDGKTTNDKLSIAFSNVTAEWAVMLDTIDWSDVPITIYKVPLSIAAPTASDYVILFSGLVDSATITLEQVQFTVSSGLGSLSSIAPRENMHQNCRFKWADDMCTQMPYHADFYKAKTLDAACTTTRLKDSALTEDTGTAASYGTDLVDALADGSITASDEVAGYSSEPVVADPVNNWITLASHGFNSNDIVTFGGTAVPTGLTAGTPYYVHLINGNIFRVSATAGGATIDLTSAGTSVTVSTPESYSGYEVKSSNGGFWKLTDNTDWGTLSHGYWQIPDAQAGLANVALKPYLQIDFGSAKTPRLWRLMSVDGVSRLEDLVRLVVFFSADNSGMSTNLRHEGYFELPPVGGTLYEFLMPLAATRRYWRICIRSKWATTFSPKMLAEVRAYEESRHWWRGGQVTFGAATSTVALRGVVRPVLESYSGEVVVPALPVAPAAGDTITIQRGCLRTFNDCCTRRNWENFGGFTDLPNQTIIR